MAVEIARSSLPDENEIFKELTLKAKGTGNKSYGPKVAQLLCFDFDANKIIIPYVYAKDNFGLNLNLM